MMPTGFALPLSVDGLGRAQIVSGSEQLAKLLIVALQPCPSENSFQQLGLSEHVIFSINAPNIRAQLNREVANIFKSFQRERRAKLIGTDFERDGVSQELKMFITYQDLETTRTEDLVLILSVNGNLRPRVVDNKR